MAERSNYIAPLENSLSAGAEEAGIA